jgi:hypothetical protein
MIERSFADMRTGENPERKGIIEKQKTPAVLLQTKKTDQTHFILGVRSFDFFHEDRHVLAVLSTILGGGMSSRLFMAVRERRGLAYSVHTGTDAYHDAGYLSTQCGVEHENLEKTIEVILEEYKRIATERVPEKELLKAFYQDYWYDTDRGGNDDVIEAAKFTHRTKEQFLTENFALYESRWQQLARAAGHSTAWEEQALPDAPTEGSYPYPGQDKMTGDSYYQQDLKLFDAATGKSKDRSSNKSDYEQPTLQEATARSLNSSYLVII